MKFFKFILIVFISVSITGCSDDAVEPLFTLSNTNIAATYDISSINILEIESATSSAGVTSELSRNNKIGDTFQVSFVINANGTYEAKGEYRSVSKVTPTPSTGQPNPKIVILNSSGTYQINTTLKKISFTQNNGNFIVGSFNIATFNESTVIINQDTTETQGGITNQIQTAITLNRK